MISKQTSKKNKWSLKFIQADGILDVFNKQIAIVLILC